MFWRCGDEQSLRRSPPCPGGAAVFRSIVPALAVLLCAATASAQDEAEIRFGGALRYNYALKSWDGERANRAKEGELDLDTFRVEADGRYRDLVLSAEYRFYSGYQVLHHGYVAWEIGDRSELRVGVSQVPFGILPYASHNWFFDVGYYVGLEDDYDAGLQYVAVSDEWDLRFAFFKNDEGQSTGNSLDSARYSYDVVRADLPAPDGTTVTRANEEVDQINARVARTFRHGLDSTTEFGISAQFGGLYNDLTRSTGRHQALAVHVAGEYGRLGVMASGISYDLSPEIVVGDPVGADMVAFGAYDAPYWVAAEGTIALLNVAWSSDWGPGPFESTTFYENASVLLKHADGFEDTWQNVIGVAAAAGPLYVYVDVATGRNHPWLGGDYVFGLAQGDPDADWETRLNVNLGYYF